MSTISFPLESPFNNERKVLNTKLRNMYTKEEEQFGQWEFFRVTEEGVTHLEPLQLLSLISLTDKPLNDIYRFYMEYDNLEGLRQDLETHEDEDDIVFVSVEDSGYPKIVTLNTLDSYTEDDVDDLTPYTLMLKRLDESFVINFKSKNDLTAINAFLNSISETDDFTLVTYDDSKEELFHSIQLNKEIILSNLYSIFNYEGSSVIYTSNEMISEGPVFLIEFKDDELTYGDKRMILNCGFSKNVNHSSLLSLEESPYGTHAELVTYLTELEKKSMHNVLLFDILDISSDGKKLSLDFGQLDSIIVLANQLLENLSDGLK